jgi:hypothetical protein
LTAPNNQNNVCRRTDIAVLKDTLGPAMLEPVIIDRLSALGAELFIFPDFATYTANGGHAGGHACSNRRVADGVFQIYLPAEYEHRLDIILHEIGHLVDFAYGVYAMGRDGHFTRYHALWHEWYFKSIRHGDPVDMQRADLHEAFAEIFCGLQAKPWGGVFLRRSLIVMLVNLVADVTDQFIKQSEDWANARR